MADGAKHAGWRGSAEVWLAAAKGALLEGGVGSVRIQPLARELKLSRTSFYWFFDTREALLAALLTDWREKNTANLVMRAGAYAESVGEAMLNIFDCWLDPELFDPRFEFAVRSWAMQAPQVLAEVRAADIARIEALTAMLARFGLTPPHADTRARAIYLVQIGYISMQTQEDLATRIGRVPAYVETFTGQAPEQRELDRFHARHGWAPR